MTPSSVVQPVPKIQAVKCCLLRCKSSCTSCPYNTCRGWVCWLLWGELTRETRLQPKWLRHYITWQALDSGGQINKSDDSIMWLYTSCKPHKKKTKKEKATSLPSSPFGLTRKQMDQADQGVKEISVPFHLGPIFSRVSRLNSLMNGKS